MTQKTVSKTLPARVRGLALRCVLAEAVGTPVFFSFPPLPVAHAASAGTSIVADPPDPGGSSTADPTLDAFQTRLLDMGKTVIKLLLFLASIVKAIAIPKGALAAQVNNLFGSATGVSHAWMNVLASVVAGGISLMSMPLVDLIFKLFVPTGSIAVHIPVPGF
jgi:hypothetical protein